MLRALGLFIPELFRGLLLPPAPHLDDVRLKESLQSSSVTLQAHVIKLQGLIHRGYTGIKDNFISSPPTLYFWQSKLQYINTQQLGLMLRISAAEDKSTFPS